MANVLRLAGLGYSRLTTNLRASFDGMSPEKWIRLVIIVGTYMLLRPYLLKLGSKAQMKQHKKDATHAEEAAPEKAKMSPNELRGHKIDKPGESDDEEEQDAAPQRSSADWGKKARRRQRTMIKKIMEAEKKLQHLQDDDEDEDIAEFLTG